MNFTLDILLKIKMTSVIDDCRMDVSTFSTEELYEILSEHNARCKKSGETYVTFL